MGYFTQTDLENALSVPIVKGAYDDDHDGKPDAGPLSACIAYGTAQCNSFLRTAMMSAGGNAVTLPLTTVPDEVKFAALDFGIAYTIRRRPDIVKAMVDKPWSEYHDAAVAQMKRYCESLQRMPATVGAHATVGGEVFAADPDDDDAPEKRWADFGDYT